MSDSLETVAYNVCLFVRCVHDVYSPITQILYILIFDETEGCSTYLMV